MTNAEAWFNNSLRPRKPEGSLGRTAQGGHLDSDTAPELCDERGARNRMIMKVYATDGGGVLGVQRRSDVRSEFNGPALFGQSVTNSPQCLMGLHCSARVLRTFFSV